MTRVRPIRGTQDFETAVVDPSCTSDKWTTYRPAATMIRLLSTVPLTKCPRWSQSARNGGHKVPTIFTPTGTCIEQNVFSQNGNYKNNITHKLIYNLCL